jgi:hypothetical protein
MSRLFVLLASCIIGLTISLYLQLSAPAYASNCGVCIPDTKFSCQGTNVGCSSPGGGCFASGTGSCATEWYTYDSNTANKKSKEFDATYMSDVACYYIGPCENIELDNKACLSSGVCYSYPTCIGSVFSSCEVCGGAGDGTYIYYNTCNAFPFYCNEG